MLNYQKVSRSVSTLRVPAGATREQFVGGDYFYIYSQSGGLDVSVNGGKYSPCEERLIQRGAIGLDAIGIVRFQNTGNADVTVVIIFGKGAMEVLNKVALVIPGVKVQCDFELVTDAQKVFQNKTSVSITNTGAADITVTCSGAPRTLQPTESVNFSVLKQEDTLVDIVVDATGSEAEVTWTA